MTTPQQSDMIEPLGKIFVRVGLNLVGKGKAGAEGVNHSPQQIKKLFLSELSKIAGQEVNYDPWNADMKGTEAPEAPAAQAASAATKRLPNWCLCRIWKASTTKQSSVDLL